MHASAWQHVHAGMHARGCVCASGSRCAKLQLMHQNGANRAIKTATTKWPEKGQKSVKSGKD